MLDIFCQQHAPKITILLYLINLYNVNIYNKCSISYNGKITDLSKRWFTLFLTQYDSTSFIMTT